tara:strand:+ start:590 stop:2218 length:1629 start_codon:yes stop_codon:yes gene_type:complete
MKKKIKLGLLIDPNRRLQEWECKLFRSIINSKYCEIKAIFYEPTKIKKKEYYKRNILNSFLHLVIKLVEKKFENTNNKKINLFKSIVKIKIYAKRKGYDDYFNSKDIQKIKKLNLDLILRRDFRILKGNILKSARHGIWSLHHGDNDFIRGIPPGFWETFLNRPTTGVTLQKINSVLDGGLIIEKGFYGTKYFWKHNENFIKEKSIQIVLKSLKKLYDNNYIKFKKSKKSLNTKYYKNPNCYHLVSYIIKKYPYFFIKKIIRIFFPFNLFINKWKICEIKNLDLKNFNNSKKIKAFSSPFYEYWADPFYFKYKKKNFLFFENYNIFKRRGKISCAEVRNGNLHNIKNIIVKNYHLSYPSIFMLEKKIFMIPETAEKKRAELWVCKKFPTEWKLHKIFFQNESWVDLNFFIDRKGNKWLFGNKSTDKYHDHNSELYIYKVLDNNFNQLIPHEKNPVIIDSRIARNAGKIFYNDKGELIRPSQVNVYENYGHGLNLNKITKLTLKDYQEITVKKVTTSNNLRLSGIHHFSLGDDNIYIDKLFKF